MESDFVFVTHYPSKSAPSMPWIDPEDPKYTLSFDLLFRGLEVTTGDSASTTTGRRWRRWRHGAWTRRILRAISWPIDMALPPHGGLGIGLERLTMQLCGLDNVRYACLFPRDLSRLEP